MIVIPLLLFLSAAPADSAMAPARDSLAMPAPVLTLPEVRVDRERMPRTARSQQPTGFVSDVRAGDTGHGFETLAELLGRAAGVRIQQYGGLGSFATVSLRGASAGQLSVYLDGVPLTSAASSVVDVSSLPATAIDRIEVYRGAAPLALGPPTPGGAIDVVTLPAGTLSRLALTRGSFDTWQGAATAGVRLGGWSALAHGGWQASDGDFGYRDDNGTPLTTADDADATRQNNAFDARTLLATVRGPVGDDVALVVRGTYVGKAQGVPGLGAVPAHDTRFASDRAIASALLERPRVGWTPAMTVEASGDRGRTQFRDLAGELGGGATDTDDRFAADQLRATATTPRVAGFTVEGSALLREERADLRDDAPGRTDPPASRRTTRGASATLTAEPWHALLLRAGIRRDRQQDALRWTTSLGQSASRDAGRTLSSPQLGALVRLPAAVTLKANWSKSQRAPEFMELFGNEGSVRGNPSLLPERSENWDAGARITAAPHRGVSAAIEWAHWEQHANDLIIYARNTVNSVRALNVSRARLRGEELTTRLELPHAIALSGWFASQGTIDLGDVSAWYGRALPQRPERHMSAQAAWRGAYADVAADVEHLGADWEDRANRLRVPARTLVGATLGVRPIAGLRVAFDAKNLGDVRAQDVAGYPLPGRSFFVTCEWDAAAPRLR